MDVQNRIMLKKIILIFIFLLVPIVSFSEDFPTERLGKVSLILDFARDKNINKEHTGILSNFDIKYKYYPEYQV